EVGDNVKTVSVGDRVCVDPNKLCGSCYYCKSAIGHFCDNIIGIGTTVDGGFAQYCAVPVSQVYKIADTTTFEQAAMCEPVACCMHGIDMCDIKTDDTVVVIGCGMIGMIMLQLAKTSGAAKIIAIEPQSEKRALAEKLGADFCIDPTSQDAKDALTRHGINRVSKVIECVGRASTMEQAIDIAGKKSIVMFFGLTAPNDTVSIKPFEIFKKEIEIKASYINPYTQQRAIEMIDSNRIDISTPVYKTVSLDELPVILADKDLRRRGKFIINPNI
ncbi:MAG: zinc-binding dehydrogenase, partial [Clostridiales bacterium]|nr:zinc-binding dehydrogenase [Clostridiales bacterium]